MQYPPSYRESHERRGSVIPSAGLETSMINRPYAIHHTMQFTSFIKDVDISIISHSLLRKLQLSKKRFLPNVIKFICMITCTASGTGVRPGGLWLLKLFTSRDSVLPSLNLASKSHSGFTLTNHLASLISFGERNLLKSYRTAYYHLRGISWCFHLLLGFPSLTPSFSSQAIRMQPYSPWVYKQLWGSLQKIYSFIFYATHLTGV